MRASYHKRNFFTVISVFHSCVQHHTNVCFCVNDTPYCVYKGTFAWKCSKLYDMEVVHSAFSHQKWCNLITRFWEGYNLIWEQCKNIFEIYFVQTILGISLNVEISCSWQETLRRMCVCYLKIRIMSSGSTVGSVKGAAKWWWFQRGVLCEYQASDFDNSPADLGQKCLDYICSVVVLPKQINQATELDGSC